MINKQSKIVQSIHLLNSKIPKIQYVYNVIRI